jgi:hypothetical protein
MDYIWYSPQNKTYQVGNAMEYDIQRANAVAPEDMSTCW